MDHKLGEQWPSGAHSMFNLLPPACQFSFFLNMFHASCLTVETSTGPSLVISVWVMFNLRTLRGLMWLFTFFHHVQILQAPYICLKRWRVEKTNRIPSIMCWGLEAKISRNAYQIKTEEVLNAPVNWIAIYLFTLPNNHKWMSSVCSLACMWISRFFLLHSGWQNRIWSGIKWTKPEGTQEDADSHRALHQQKLGQSISCHC